MLPDLAPCAAPVSLAGVTLSKLGFYTASLDLATGHAGSLILNLLRRILVTPANIVGSVLLAAALATAEGIAQQVATQSTLVANRDIIIFDAPRNGLFCSRGERIGQMPKGTEVAKYEEVESHCGLFQKHYYLRFLYTKPDGKSVLAYVRRKEDDQTDRFIAKGK
jgi:hypothetical protein